MASSSSRKGMWAGVGIGVLALAATWALTVSPLFRMEQVSVTGTDHLTRSAVLKLAQVTDATNVLWLSTGEVADRIEADPWIAEASVSKDLPSSLTIRVQERTPAMTSGGSHRWMLIASDGVVLDVVKATPDLPEAPGIPTTDAGGSIPADRIPSAHLAGLLGAAGVLDAVESIITDPAGELRVSLTDGGKVAVGPPDSLEQKADAIAGIVVWAQQNHSKIRSIDVTAPDAPAAKVSRGAPPVEG